MPEGANISSGIGTGEAQVFRPYDVRPFVEQQQALQMQEEKEKRGREGKVISSLAPLDKIDIFFRDQSLFKNKIGDVRNFAKQNIDALRSGDPTVTMDFQSMLTDIYNEASLSKNARENFEKIAMDVYKNQDKYDESSLEYLDDFTSGKNIGNYQFDVTKILPKVDLFNDIKTNVKLNPTETNYEYIDPSTGNKITTSSKRITPKEADAILEQRLMGDPMLFASATKQYERLKKLGKTTDADVVTWYKNYTRPALVETSTTYKNIPTQWSKSQFTFGDGSATSNKYNFVYKPKTESSPEQIDIASTDYTENKPLLLPDPKNKKNSISVTPTKLGKGYMDPKGGWQLTAIDENGEEVIFSLDEIGAKFEANYGINPRDLISKIKGGGTVKTNPSTGGKEVKKNTGTKKEYIIKGTEYSLQELMDMGYTEEQVSSYKK